MTGVHEVRARLHALSLDCAKVWSSGMILGSSDGSRRVDHMQRIEIDWDEIVAKFHEEFRDIFAKSKKVLHFSASSAVLSISNAKVSLGPFQLLTSSIKSD